MRIYQPLAMAVALLTTTAAHAAPGTPHVTMGADLKQLIFDWEPVPGATHYRLFEDTGGGYTRVSDDIPAWRTRARLNVAVHLQRWSSTRYKVAACNRSGCTRSAEVNPQDLMLDTIGYFKASNTEAGDNFGRTVLVSADGQTLVVSAQGEDSNATGVNGNQANNGSPSSGAVYVYRRQGGQWTQEAYLKAGVNEPEQYFGSGYPFDFRAVAMNADGSLLAIGAPDEDVGGALNPGAVYIYARAESGSWSLTATLHSPSPLSNDYFGTSVDMSLDGRTLKVNTAQPQDGEGNPEMRTHIFVRPDDTWQHSVTLPPIHAGDFCQAVRLSGDGHTLVFNCISYQGNGIYVGTMKRSGDAWTVASVMATSSGMTNQPLALSHDGTVMALTEGNVPRAVRVYRWNGMNWTAIQGLAGPSSDPNGSPAWGYSIALSGNGRVLAIGDISGDVAGAGVSETATPGTEPQGMVVVYEYEDDDVPGWVFRSVVKAPNPQVEDLYGISISMNRNGRTLAVGAMFEDSAATGIDGNQNDESAQQAGAAYLY
jgi:trimeric autotransporter adhesin